MKQQIRLTESDLHRIVKESVKKLLKEGTTNNIVINKWNNIEQTLGSETMLSELFQYLDGDTIADFVNTIENAYDIEDEGYE